MPQWTADIDVTAALAARLIASQFPELSGADVEPFGGGWDNAAFLVDGHLVFRFPRRRVAGGLIEREVAILPPIAASLPLAISAPAFIGRKTGDYPWVFAGYERIGGRTSCSVVLSVDVRAALAAPLAVFLRALHAVDPAASMARGLQPDEIGRLDHDKRFALTRERVPALEAAGALHGGSMFTNWLGAHPPVRVHDAARRIVHGDLYARHVLVDDRGRPTGVIDWGDVHLGDPALDIAIAHLILPLHAHAAFRAAYGPIDEQTWAAARYRAIYHAVVELDFGLAEDDAGMRESGLLALRMIRAAIE